MAGLSEVPTEELLSFQDYPTVHTSPISSTAQLKVDTMPEQDTNTFTNFGKKSMEDQMFNENQEESNTAAVKSFWTIEYYQQFFDVDTKDVIDRIIYSMFPKKDSTYKYGMKARPDLYGPFWIAITLTFTISVSGNVATYLQHANEQIHWKYNFHLASSAATAIFLYITIIPFTLWALMKWSINVINMEGLEDCAPPGILELISIYGYSLFIYIPVSVLWIIQVDSLQWTLLVVAACLSGSVLLLVLSPSIKQSKYKLILIIGIISMHLLLSFMLYFFIPNSEVEKPNVVQINKVNSTD